MIQRVCVKVVYVLRLQRWLARLNLSCLRMCVSMCVCVVACVCVSLRVCVCVCVLHILVQKNLAASHFSTDVQRAVGGLRLGFGG